MSLQGLAYFGFGSGVDVIILKRILDGGTNRIAGIGSRWARIGSGLLRIRPGDRVSDRGWQTPDSAQEAGPD